MRNFEDYIYPAEGKLFAMLCKDFRGSAIISKGNYILVPGDAPIMLVAHLDTVHKEPVRDLCKTKNGNILMSPQGIGGDDRCGVFALNSVHNQCVAKPWLLFTCEEETGGQGAAVFARDYEAGKLPDGLAALKMLVEIDRRGSEDAVYYDCDNTDFEDYITSKGFKTAWGSFSDISTIAPALGVAAVNLSSGYYNAHTLYEYIDRAELEETIRKVASIVDDVTGPDFPAYEYIEAVHTYTVGYPHAGYYSSWGDYDWDADLKIWRKKEDVPAQYRREYNALLGQYTKGELDSFRRQFGDAIIANMFRSEFGGDYDEVFWEDEDDEI